MDAYIIPLDFGAAKNDNAEAKEDDKPQERPFNPDLDLSWHQDHSSLWWTVKALTATPAIKRVFVLTTDSPNLNDFLKSIVADFPATHMYRVPDLTASEKDFAALQSQLEPLRTQLKEPVLLCSASTPLATHSDYDEFLRQYGQHKSAGALACVSRQKLEETVGTAPPLDFSPLKNDEWRPANAAIISRPVFDSIIELLSILDTQANTSEDKKSSDWSSIRAFWPLVRRVGPVFLWKAFRRQLSLEDLEKAASKLLNCDVKAIRLSSPKLAVMASHPNFERIAGKASNEA